MYAAMIGDRQNELSELKSKAKFAEAEDALGALWPAHMQSHGSRRNYPFDSLTAYPVGVSHGCCLHILSHSADRANWEDFQLVADRVGDPVVLWELTTGMKLCCQVIWEASGSRQRAVQRLGSNPNRQNFQILDSGKFMSQLP